MFGFNFSMEYDCYGFLVYAKEEETDDILVAKANKLEWQSHQLANRIKVKYACETLNFPHLVNLLTLILALLELYES